MGPTRIISWWANTTRQDQSQRLCLSQGRAHVPLVEPSSWLGDQKRFPRPLSESTGVRISPAGRGGIWEPWADVFREVRGRHELVGGGRHSNDLQFAGYTWNIKNGICRSGYNWFFPRCAFVDTMAGLHLEFQSRPINNEWGEATTNWSCAEWPVAFPGVWSVHLVCHTPR